MENNKVVDSKKKLIPIIVIVAVILVVAAIAILASKKSTTPTTTPEGTVTGDQTGTTPEGQAGEVDTTTGGEGAATTTEAAVIPILVNAKVEAPGADLIATTGQVVNAAGEEVKTDVAYNSPEAPKQTMPVAIAEIPFATKLTLTEEGFNPKEFRIAKGKAITVSLTGSADSSHIFAFESPLLSSVYINVRPNETRAVTFNAPTQAGEYFFFCDFPGHREKGETGKMIVE